MSEPSTGTTTAAAGSARPSRGHLRRSWRHWLGAAAVAAACAVMIDARLWRPDHVLLAQENPQVAEAQAWWSGRLDLAERHWDTALVDGRIYSHFPPMFSLLAAVFVPVFRGVPHWFVVLGLALPVPLLAYGLASRRTGAPAWAAMIAVGLLMGTSLWPVLRLAIRSGAPYYVNHLLAVVGSLLFLREYFGARRTVPAAIGVTIAALSRQMTGALFVPLAYMAWTSEGAGRRRRLLTVAAFFGATTGLYMALNTLKFGHPFDSGYMKVYAERPEDAFSRDARAHGIFSPYYVPRNLYFLNIGLPEWHRIEIGSEVQRHVVPNDLGTGIWWTTPVLLWLFADWRRIVRDPAARALLGAAVLIFAALLVYHSTGAVQRGFNRYSLDFLPALFALIAPSAVRHPRRGVTLAFVAWSVLYYVIILPRPHVRVW